MQQDEAIRQYLEYGRVLGESSNLSISFAYSFPHLSKLLTSVLFVTERTSSVSFWYRGYSIVLKYQQSKWYVLPIIVEGGEKHALEVKDEEQIFYILRDIDRREEKRQQAQVKTQERKTRKKKTA